MPKNASISAGGFRIYDWAGGDTELHRIFEATEPTQLLSVTSIKALCGEAIPLVNWKINNVVSVAMGTRMVPAIGKRGRPLKGKFTVAKDGPFPGEFVTRMMETRGLQEGLESVKAWLREQADEPRNVAAVRGSVVHKMIEMNLPMSVIDEDVIRQRFAVQWAEENNRVKPEVTMEDVAFVEDGMRNYWDMRVNVPFVIIAQEPQVFNLKVGYAGSADVILWFIGTWETGRTGADENDEDVYETTFHPLPNAEAIAVNMQRAANKGLVTAEMIQEVGGQVAVGDWKTSKGVYTSHVTQTTAYLNAEFIAEDGVIDGRLSDILGLAGLGMVIHIRPDKWFVGLFENRKDTVRAFLGSVAFARFIALYKYPSQLFVHTASGRAEGVAEEDNANEAA